MANVSINLDGVSYYSPSYPFIDRMKTAEWHFMFGDTVPLKDTAGALPVMSADQGYTIMIGTDDQKFGTPSKYVLTWDGDPNFDATSNFANITRVGDHKYVVDMKPGMPWLDLRAVVHANQTVSNVHLVREDQVDLFNRGEIFNPEFINKIEPFDTIRTMDWGRTNTADNPAAWSDRTQANDLTWATGGRLGVPIEVMVKLANETNNNLWYNVPFQATDEYVTNAIKYIHDNLKPELQVYVEYSNEVWNWAFPAASLAAQKGIALGFDPNSGPNLAYYGYRSAQISQLTKAAFGPDPSDRLHNVLATQTGWQGLFQWHMQPAIQRVGNPADLFDSYAVTTYFGISFAGADPADRPKLLEWARSGDAGLNAAFQELEFGGTLRDNSSLARLAAVLAQEKSVADQFGWKMVGYEGGAHTTGFQTGNAADDAALNAFIDRLINDPRMGGLYSKMVDVFSAAGGDNVAAFTESGKFWGVLPSIYDDSSPRYDALIDKARAAGQIGGILGTSGADNIIGTTGADRMEGLAGDDTYLVNHVGDSVIEAANGGMDAINTSLNTYTLPAFVERLTFVGAGAFAGTGNDLDNIITGGAGSDTLSGGAGADTLIGGMGDDRYILDNAGDVVVEAAGQGMDRVFSSVTYTLGANIESLTLTGAGAIDGIGNSLANEIYGNEAANRLSGGAGNDVLSGGLGNDWLDGGDGADVLDGGAGADTMYGGNGNDVMMGAGRDTMIGGAGDDTYYVDDAGDMVVELPNEGRDTVRATIDYVLPAEVERLWLSGSATRGIGNSLDNVINYSGSNAVTISGLDGNDTLEGGAGADTLDGGSGDDRLTGGAGADVLIGGAGRDILDGGAGADRFVIRPGDSGTTNVTADMILGFSHAEGDKIDLSAFDAIPGGADDPFRFIGAMDFSRSAGELRAFASAPNLMTVQGDTNGDGVPDFCLLVSTGVPLVATDFAL